MKGKEFDIKKKALETIREEANAVMQLTRQLNDDFVKVVELIYQSDGRVIITGIGKSAIIATKIVSTFNSTGTPAVFMHAADAVHGDLGIIRDNDVVMCLSKSGNTAEIKVLIPFLKLRKNPLIGMVGNRYSYLAKQADFVLDTTVTKEACPNNLAPTSSTTAQLVMGDALAVTLLEYRGFSAKDFARYHPGGALGKQLYLKVNDLYINNEKPQVSPEDSLKQVIVEISSKRLGATAVVSEGRLLGIITDGDLRRMLEAGKDLEVVKAGEIYSAHPKTVLPEMLVSDALDIMRGNNITQLLVADTKGTYLGVIHLHDILKEGII